MLKWGATKISAVTTTSPLIACTTISKVNLLHLKSPSEVSVLPGRERYSVVSGILPMPQSDLHNRSPCSQRGSLRSTLRISRIRVLHGFYVFILRYKYVFSRVGISMMDICNGCDVIEYDRRAELCNAQLNRK